MKNDWPCKCSHRLDEHEQLTWNFSNPINIISERSCMIVTSRWFGTVQMAHCLCKDYNSISNLEFLEYKYETNSNS